MNEALGGRGGDGYGYEDGESSSSANPGVFRALFGAMGFPFAFTTIVVCGGELFTSMCAYTAAAAWERKTRAADVLRLLGITFAGNFAGCALMVGLVYASDLFSEENGDLQFLVYITEAKVSMGWGKTFVRAILANWLVGIATWMANAAQDLTGKFVGIWLPISAFAAIGLEHSIANMYLLPLGIAYGAAVTPKQFVWRNIIPVTLGNWLGGAVAVASTYALVYGGTLASLKARIFTRS